MIWGPEAETLEAWIEEGRPVPPGYLDRPPVEPESAFVWEAFWELSSDRDSGFGEGDIPFRAIDRFAQRYGIDDLDEFDEFRSMIRGVDREYLKIRAEQREADKEPASSSKKRPV